MTILRSGVMPGGTAPALNAAAVTKSDTADVYCRMLYVGGTGDVTVMMEGETDPTVVVKFSAVPVGTVLPIRARRIMSTGTSATLMVALY